MFIINIFIYLRIHGVRVPISLCVCMYWGGGGGGRFYPEFMVCGFLGFFFKCSFPITSIHICMFMRTITCESGPDLGLGKLGSWPVASTTRGPPHMSCHLLFIFLVFQGRVRHHSSTTEGCPGASPCLTPALM